MVPKLKVDIHSKVTLSSLWGGPDYHKVVLAHNYASYD